MTLGTANPDFMGLLEKTSRSFYLGIQGLRPELQEAVCLGYLVCRILDTYEDATCVDPIERIETLGYLEDDLKNITLHFAKFSMFDDAWKTYFDQHPGERELIEAAPAVFERIARLPMPVQKAFSKHLPPMAHGMQLEVKKRQLERKLSPRSNKELLDYCFYVAGTVGLFLTDLFWQQKAFKEDADLSVLYQQGEAFGKTLQLVNIAKDFHRDFGEGRVFWPLIHNGEKSLPPLETLLEAWNILVLEFESHAAIAKAYIKNIHPDAHDVHFFCKFPLKMAIESFKVGREDMEWLEKGSTFKVDREKTFEILAECQKN